MPPLHLFLPKNGPSDSSALASVGFPLPRNFCQPGGDTVNSMGILLPRIFCLPSRDIVNSVGFPLPGYSPGHCQFFWVFVTKKFMPTQRGTLSIQWGFLYQEFPANLAGTPLTLWVSVIRKFLPARQGHRQLSRVSAALAVTPLTQLVFHCQEKYVNSAETRSTQCVVSFIRKFLPTRWGHQQLSGVFVTRKFLPS